MTIHKSVLLAETIEYLNLKSGAVCVDATLGGGGHTIEILKRISPGGKLIALDADNDAIERFRERTGIQEQEQKGEIILVNSNFGELVTALGELGIEKVDAVMADLGYSSDQIEDRERGLSFLYDAPLDMRFDRKQELTAKEVVNRYGKGELENILKEYGEEKFYRNIVREIIRQRQEKEIAGVKELVEIIEKAVPQKYRNKKIHPATKTFQAIRIEVNQELTNLRKFVQSAIGMLKPGGRLAIISFHSLEDRIVKEIFRENARGCICPNDFPICICGQTPRVKIISKKVIIPRGEELAENLRARSAKLRVCELI